MHITLHYDKDGSKITGKPMFASEDFPVTWKFIGELKRMGVLKLVDESMLPDEILCHVVAHFETPTSLHCMFFNADFVIPPECYEEPLFNKQLLDWSETHGGFWIEVVVPLNDDYLTLILSD